MDKFIDNIKSYIYTQEARLDETVFLPWKVMIFICVKYMKPETE